MRYIDTGPRDPAHSLAKWLEANLLRDTSVAELRWQSGYFSQEVLPFFAPTLSRVGPGGGAVRLLVGSNDGTTRQVDMATLLAMTGPPRPGLNVGVVSFANGYFHPKTVHLLRSDGSAAAYVGSANLTGAGVALNVEAGIVLDTRDGDDRGVLNAVGAAVDWWFSGGRPGLHLVSTSADLASLASAGILDVPQPPRPAAGGHGSGSRGATLRHLLTIPGPAPPFQSRSSPASPGALPASSGAPAASPGAPAASPRVSTATRWTKKLSASDAQRKSTGNQRGSITLVRAGASIDPKIYFRTTLFSGAAWTRSTTATGQPIETAWINFDVTLPGQHLGAMDIEVSYAPNREAAQSNYTSLLHLGPLAPHFAVQNMTGRHLMIERHANGTFSLTIA